MKFEDNQVPISLPINLRGNYSVICPMKPFIAYYKLKPLSVLTFGKNYYEYETIKSMTKLRSNIFYFNIHKSSTIQLCIIFMNENNIDQHYLCREIHIGINQIYHFWNFPLKVLYICLICFITTYYILYAVFKKCYKTTQQPKLKVSSINRQRLNRQETFEHEKIHEFSSEE